MKSNKKNRDRKCLECKKLVVFSLIGIVLILLWYSRINPWKVKNVNNLGEMKEMLNKKVYIDTQTQGFEGYKIVHIDLKGAPPKINYFRQLFPLLSNLGATGLLIEYEDTFPYKGILQNISALNGYSLEDIQTLNRLAQASNLTVIPLIQTIGHLEFILKLEKFEALRAVAEYPHVICPYDKRSFAIIFEMITQIVETHPYINTIHIGADEVNYIAQCEIETEIFDHNWTKNQLFLAHIKEVVKYIRKHYPHLRILMWDDELRSMSLKDLKQSEITNFVEPVVWKYTANVYNDLGPSLWYLYAGLFPKIWIASAFKGATGSNKYLTEVTHHVENHRSWLYVVSEFKEKINFQGIIITGWQRYDHFSVLCELLPVGMSSLALCLRLIMGYEVSLLSPPTEIAKILQCEQPFALLGPVFGSPKCSYPGANVLEHILRFHQIKQEYETIIEDDRYKGWMSEYNIKHSFSSPRIVETLISHLQRLFSDLIEVNKEISLSFGEVYDNYTIKEWQETYVTPLINRIVTVLNQKHKLFPSCWPRRPLSDSIE